MCRGQALPIFFGPDGGSVIQDQLSTLEEPDYGFVKDLISDLPLDGHYTNLRHWIIQVLVNCSHGEICVQDAKVAAMEIDLPVHIYMRDLKRIVGEAEDPGLWGHIKDPYAGSLVLRALALCKSTQLVKGVRLSGPITPDMASLAHHGARRGLSRLRMCPEQRGCFSWRLS